MNISVFGLGYVGCVTATCLAKNGHKVCGVDNTQEKVQMILEGKSPILEKGVEDLVKEVRKEGRLEASVDFYQPIMETDISLVCVGTPSNWNGSLDLTAIKTVASQIGSVLKDKSSYHCIVFRSTVLPGTVRNILIPLLNETSGKQAHVDFDVCFNPEFLREGTVDDFYHPPFTVIGEATSRGGDMVARLYPVTNAPIERTTYEVAEMVKYASNSFHAVKVTFANEIGTICKSLGIDSHQVMDLFTLDKQLNISSAYLKPGFAFGGSCLPKDLRALVYQAAQRDLQVPLLSSLLESNRRQIERVLEYIIRKKVRKIGILGLSFKCGTDDLRESPIVALIERLIGKGYQLKIFDSDISLERLTGTNKQFIESEVPHIATHISTDFHEVIYESEMIVVAKASPQFKEALEQENEKKPVLDLVRIIPQGELTIESYEGLCW